ncbi:hypothetical protein Tco_0365322 [Tanacetum coccineum]
MIIHTPVLDKLFAVSAETEILKVMKIFFEQQIDEEELDGKYLVKKIADVKDSLKRDNKTRLEVKLSRLTQLEYENAEGVKELKVHSSIMELCEED